MIELELRSDGFCGERKMGWRSQRKTLGARTKTNKKLNRHMRLGMEIDPGHIGGKRRSHHCAIPDPPTRRHFVYCLYFLENTIQLTISARFICLTIGVYITCFFSKIAASNNYNIISYTQKFERK